MSIGLYWSAVFNILLLLLLLFSFTNASSRRKIIFICILPVLQSTEDGGSMAAFYLSITTCTSIFSDLRTVSLFKPYPAGATPVGDARQRREPLCHLVCSLPCCTCFARGAVQPSDLSFLHRLWAHTSAKNMRVSFQILFRCGHLWFQLSYSIPRKQACLGF